MRNAPKETTMADTLEALLSKGDHALRADDTLVALLQFEMAHSIGR